MKKLLFIIFLTLSSCADFVSKVDQMAGHNSAFDKKLYISDTINKENIFCLMIESSPEDSIKLILNNHLLFYSRCDDGIDLCFKPDSNNKNYLVLKYSKFIS